MEIRKGYKQTEIGIIPNDWEIKNLENITISMVQGVNTAIDVPEYVEDGVPMLKANDIIDGNINLDNADKISVKTFSNYTERFKIKKNDFLLSNIGARLGSGSLYDLEKESSYAWNVMRITPNLKLISPLFLSLSINSPSFNKLILSNQMGSGMGFVPKNVLKKLNISLPPTLKEQSTIATALSDSDTWINSLEQLLTKKRQIKQGAMQELLQPKDGWEVKKLGEVGKCHRGVSYNPEKDLHDYDKINTFRLLRSNNIKNGSLNNINIQFVDYSRVKENQVLQKNDIIICMANGSKQLVGKSGIFIIDDSIKYTFGAFMGCFRTNEKIASSKYIAINFQSYQYRNFIDVLLSGSSINNLNPSDIESINIPFPPREEQTRIATILSDMDEEIAQLETKLAKAKQIKQGMMQELLTGRIRLV